MHFVNTIAGVLFIDIPLNMAIGFLIGKILLWIDRKKLKENPTRERWFLVSVIIGALIWKMLESYVTNDFRGIEDDFITAAGFVLAVFLSTFPPRKKKPKKPREKVVFNPHKHRWTAVPSPA